MTTATHNFTGSSSKRGGWFGVPGTTQATKRRTLCNRHGHLCNSYAFVEGTGGAYTCEHGFSVAPQDVAAAQLRANQQAADGTAASAHSAATVPGHAASEQSIPVGRKPHQGDSCSEAVLMACALAWEGNAHAGVDVTVEQARRWVNRAMVNGRTRVLGWRQYTFETLCDEQWRWAVRTLQRLFPDVPGAASLPEDHNEAGLPKLAAAPLS